MKILTHPFFFKLRGGDEAVIYHMNGERRRKIQRQNREKKEKLANEALKRLSKLKDGDAEAMRAVAEKFGYGGTGAPACAAGPGATRSTSGRVASARRTTRMADAHSTLRRWLFHELPITGTHR